MTKLTFVLFALAASVAASSAFSNFSCGQTSVRPRALRVADGGRIVGGEEAKPNSYPYQVSLQQYGYAHFCGGSLIRVNDQDKSDIVITAAHCVYDGWTGLTVAAGSHNLDRPTSNEQKAEASKVVYHPQYDPESTINDIAIIKLKTPIRFTAAVQPVCPPTAGEELAEGTLATVTGWGATAEDGDASRVLMQVGVPVIGHASCARSYASQGITIDRSAMLCAGFAQGGKDSCQGDSGGPFVTQGAKGYTLHGVVSFGVGCARRGSPGVYAKVSNYLPWINQQVKAMSALAG